MLDFFRFTGCCYLGTIMLWASPVLSQDCYFPEIHDNANKTTLERLREQVELKREELERNLQKIEEDRQKIEEDRKDKINSIHQERIKKLSDFEKGIINKDQLDNIMDNLAKYNKEARLVYNKDIENYKQKINDYKQSIQKDYTLPKDNYLKCMETYHEKIQEYNKAVKNKGIYFKKSIALLF